MAAMAAIYFWISNPNDFSYFDLLVTPMFSIKYQDNWPFVSGEAKHMMVAMVDSLDFDRNELSWFFALQDTPMLPTKFQINWPFGSRESPKNIFSR